MDAVFNPHSKGKDLLRMAQRKTTLRAIRRTLDHATEMQRNPRHPLRRAYQNSGHDGTIADYLEHEISDVLETLRSHL